MHMKLRTVYLIVLALILLSAVIVMISSFSNIAAETSAAAGTAVIPDIVIDAGHGGEDGGAEADDVLEKDINLCISADLADLLRLSGCHVTQVRSTDTAIYSDEAETLREKKKSDLQNRVALFNADARNIVVSIHQNKFENSRYSGTQLFYSGNHAGSRQLAENIRTAVVMLLQPDNTRELKQAGSDIYILDQTVVPAVIVECGFLSNDAERALLIDPDYQKRMSYAIAMGVLDYCHQENTV